MKASIGRRRVAVLAYTPRSREFARRALRSLGYAPLVFSAVDELEAMGSRVASLDMLLLGDVPEVDCQGRMALAEGIAAVGPRVPVLHAPLNRRGVPRPPEPSGARVQRAAPRYFAELYGAIVRFMAAHRFDSAPSRLAWDGHVFHPMDRTVAVDGEEVKLDAVAFDVALELFFNAGRPLSRKWLRRMLPLGEHGANWHSIDNLPVTIDDLCVAIRLDQAKGWRLERLPEDSYCLRRVGRADHPPARSIGRRVVPAR